MNILKIALLYCLRVAFFASLKVALLAYTVFLSDTAFASNGRAMEMSAIPFPLPDRR
jgi:hypothetical protein